MSNVKWKCNDCEHLFEADNESTRYCSNCQSTNIEKLQDGNGLLANFKMFYSKYRNILLPILGLFLIIFFFSISTPPPPGNTKEVYYIGSIKQESNYVLFKLLCKEINENDNVTKSGIEVKISQYEKVLKKITINSTGKKLNFKGDKIYICKKDTGLITLLFESKKSYRLKDSKSYEETQPVYFTLVGKQPNPLSICDIDPLNSSEIEFKSGKDCFTSIILPPRFNKKNAYYSISGRNGPYTSSKSFSTEKMDLYNVWVYVEDSTINEPVGAIKNGEKVTKTCCTPVEVKLIENTLQSLLQDYMKEPDNDTKSENAKNYFYDHFSITENVIIINGAKVKGWAGIENEIDNSQINGEKVRLNKIIVAEKCKFITIILTVN
jgi:hypothetical protein